MEKEKILNLVREYYRENHMRKEYEPGDRINYAGRVYDEEELVNLVDSSLEFWLTAGRYTKEFESGLGQYLGVPYVSVVNSGSSANLLAVAALTSPLLRRGGCKKEMRSSQLQQHFLQQLLRLYSVVQFRYFLI